MRIEHYLLVPCTYHLGFVNTLKDGNATWLRDKMQIIQIVARREGAEAHLVGRAAGAYCRRLMSATVCGDRPGRDVLQRNT